MALGIRRLVLALAGLLVLAACAGPDGGAAPAPGTPADPASKIRFALDWTPNTNHTGLFVAQQEGWFAAAGLDVEILPYNNASPDTLVAAGRRRVRGQLPGLVHRSPRRPGADIISVMAVLQHWATEIAVRADRADIPSPPDLDGKIYAGFGAA